MCPFHNLWVAISNIAQVIFCFSSIVRGRRVRTLAGKIAYERTLVEVAFGQQRSGSSLFFYFVLQILCMSDLWSRIPQLPFQNFIFDTRRAMMKLSVQNRRRICFVSLILLPRLEHIFVTLNFVLRRAPVRNYLKWGFKLRFSAHYYTCGCGQTGSRNKAQNPYSLI